MTKLDRNARLQRVPELTLHVKSSNQVEILTGGRMYRGDSFTMAVLEVFHQPTSVNEAIQRMGGLARTAQDWIYMTSTIFSLYEAKILRLADEIDPQLGAQPGYFDAADIHALLLNDRVRTQRYIDAIHQVVRSGDVVIDIGTGSGVLALAAAQAGARHVYAVEATSIGKVARQVFEANGVGDRVTVIEGWSTQIELPERADVLVHELISNDTLGEQILEITWDAMKRLLKPNPRMVPGHIKTYVLPIHLPDKPYSKQRFTPGSVTDWQAWYGMNFMPLREASGKTPSYMLWSSKRKGGATSHEDDPRFLGQAALVMNIDLMTLQDTLPTIEGEIVIDTPGTLNGILTYFDADLSPAVPLCTDPRLDERPNSWANPVWLFEPMAVEAGARFAVRLPYKTSVKHAEIVPL